MQALSSYSPENRSLVEPALASLQDQAQWLTVAGCYSARGMFVRFIWPDWPPALAEELGSRVREFRSEQPELRPVQAGTREWDAVFHGWRSDSDSASAIAAAFAKHFGNRVRWVESEVDARGRISARAMVEGLRAPPPPPPGAPPSLRAGWRISSSEVTLDLYWKDSIVTPPGPLSVADDQAFYESVKEISFWAQRRIQPILDILQERLKALYGERFRGLYVFGSYARPDAGIELPESSDLDVALILSDFENLYEERARFGDLVADLSLEHSMVISVVPVAEADFREGRTNFSRVISEYAVPVK
jgi:predicted nucleotidyltransferase